MEAGVLARSPYEQLFVIHVAHQPPRQLPPLQWTMPSNFGATAESEQTESMASLPSIGQVLRGRISAYSIVKELQRAADNGAVFLAT